MTCRGICDPLAPPYTDRCTFSPGMAMSESTSNSVKFQCTQDKAALLMLSSRGQETVIRNTRQIVTYMREHLDSWEELANGVLDLELLREEIFFVYGVTKTASHWGVAAFADLRRIVDTPATVSCHFDSGTPAQPKIDFNIVTESGLQPGGEVWWRTGPWRARKSFAPAASESVLTIDSGPTTRTAPSVMYRPTNYSAFDSAESLRSRSTHATSAPTMLQSSSPASFSDSSLSVNSLSGSVLTLESISVSCIFLTVTPATH